MEVNYKVLYEDLLPKYKNLTIWFDNHFGTPCEQIRHTEEVSLLKEENKKLRQELEETYQHLDEVLDNGII